MPNVSNDWLGKSNYRRFAHQFVTEESAFTQRLFPLWLSLNDSRAFQIKDNAAGKKGGVGSSDPITLRGQPVHVNAVTKS